MRLGRSSRTAISRWSRGRCERHPDGRLKKRTGFGSHPGGRKPKPDAAGMQVAHGDFSLESREMRAASRRAVEKADRFRFAPWREKTQARCVWDASRARRFLTGVAGDASRIQTAIEKADRFRFAPWRAKTQARCGWDVRSASTFRRHVQRLKPQDKATIQKEMAWS